MGKKGLCAAYVLGIGQFAVSARPVCLENRSVFIGYQMILNAIWNMLTEVN